MRITRSPQDYATAFHLLSVTSRHPENIVTARRPPSGRDDDEPARRRSEARKRQSELVGSVTVPGCSMAASAARSR